MIGKKIKTVDSILANMRQDVKDLQAISENEKNKAAGHAAEMERQQKLRDTALNVAHRASTTADNFAKLIGDK